MVANIEKSKTMNFQSGEIHIGSSEEAFSWMSTGEGSTYRERLRQCTQCPDCRVELIGGYITAYFIQLHGKYLAIEWDQLPVSHMEHLPLVYEFGFLTNMQSCHYQFPGCSGTSRSRSGLHNHFSRLHSVGIILILEEHPTPFPHCERYGRQVTRG